MVITIAHNIYSPLGHSSEENYRAVKAGRSMLRRYDHCWGLPESCTASLFDDGVFADSPQHTRFEQMVITSATAALAQANIDPASPRTLFVLSTTKGNVHLLDKRITGFESDRVLPGVTAKIIARHFGNTNEPVVVSNACISGVCALIAAMRQLEQGNYDHAVVMGADMQSPFIMSGFQSFKALSPVACKPFDQNRQGLNLGEAAATIVLARAEHAAGVWQLVRGAIRNDANHISGPSRTGEGSYRALRAAIGDMPASQLAFINAHGTATNYNDEMESIAIQRAGLQDVPVNSLKGYYGHTMGAAGVLESIISMQAVEDGTVLATRGFETLGTSQPIHVSNQHSTTDRKAFVKLLSGFGGCNAALLFRKEASL